MGWYISQIKNGFNTINMYLKTNLVTFSVTDFFFDDFGCSEMAFCALLVFAGFVATFTCVLAND